MRPLLLFFVFFNLILARNTENLAKINEDIHLNEQKIQKKESEKTQITIMLQKLGEEIQQKNKKIKRLDVEIRLLQSTIENNQDKNIAQEKLLVQYQRLLTSLQQQQVETKSKITQILINDLAFILVLNRQNPISPDDIILQEIFKLLSQKSQDKIKLLVKEEEIISQKIAQTTQAITFLDKNITHQKNQKNSLQDILKEQKKLIANLQNDLQLYNQKLRQNDEERKSLDEILNRLNIVKQTKEKELQEKMREKALKEKEELSKQPLTPSSPLPDSPIEVKQVANSYQELSVAKYQGQRTIAPIESYEVEQKFGSYFDPVYKLKVFNESVILNSKIPDAPVRSIFDGKVVYAKEVPILKRVVIIENEGGIHTIYSQLDKIAPTIKVGLRIKRGYVIGRVKQKLSFEITQKDKHIDPLEVITKSK